MKINEKEVLQAMRDFRKRAEDYWSEIYQQAEEDMEFCINKESQWDKRAREERKKAGRPCISINKTMLFVKQQVNALRANKLTLNAIPVDDTDVAKAEIQDDMLDYVLKSSHADIATDWAYEKAVMGGFGFWRITTDYESPTSFNQDIKVERIENPLSTYLSPNIKSPTGSDSEEALTGDWISKSEFKRLYPKCEPVNALDEEVRGEWITEDETVFVAEYYRVEYEKDVLYLLDNGETLLESEFDNYQGSASVVNKRDTHRKKIMWYRCSRDKVLDYTEIKADYIPIILVIGDEQWVKDKRYWQSLIANSKDPQVIYNYARTLQLEQLRKAMNRPLIADARSIEGYEDFWENSDDPSVKYVPYNSIDEQGRQLAPPFLANVYQGSPDLMRETLTASDEIKATTGIFDASLGSQGNETSGKAIMARQRQGDQANFHFLDNFKRSYEHAGRVILSMIPHYYDMPRVLRISQDDTVYKTLVINAPQGSPMAEKYEKELQKAVLGANYIYNDVTKGRYDIRIATGASYNTQREEAREVLIELGRAYPQLMQVAGDEIIKAFDFPEAEKIAERLKLMLPPQLQKGEDGEQPQLPPEAQQQVQQMQQQMQQLNQALQQAQAELSSKEKDRQLEMMKAQLKLDTDVEIAKIRESGRNDQEELKQYGDILKAILDKTSDIQQAMQEGENLPDDWLQQSEDLQNPVSNEQGFFMSEDLNNG